jgi:ATP-binding cassette subfamily F protein 3
MAAQETLVSFDTVTFTYENDHQILDEVDFSVRKGSKVTIMGQNGAGKSTIFKLITKQFTPTDGRVNVVPGVSIAIAPQVTPQEDRELTVKAFFEKYHGEKAYDIDRKIDDVLAIVNVHAPKDRIIKSFSGGQQARLLLASALIQDPDVLLLDEPTNNLDHTGIDHLLNFIFDYPKTVIVISHDADFLNAFTDTVLYLDIFTKKVEQYEGNYFDVVEQIEIRKQKENSKNAQLAKGIQEKRDKANVFAHKGGKMRAVAKRMNRLADELEDEVVDVRREDKTIRDFTIPCQENIGGEIVKIDSFTIIQNHEPVVKKASVIVRKNQHLLLTGPNGIGKSTLLEALATGTAKGATIGEDIRVGYYRQDFSTLNFEHTVHQSLLEALESAAGTGKSMEELLRSVAAGFLITSALINSKIGTLSEGQKGLVAFARLVLQRPGLLILDEPTNHINFRHLPVIAKALDEYTGAMILVSHVPDFVMQVRIDQELDLTRNH